MVASVGTPNEVRSIGPSGHLTDPRELRIILDGVVDALQGLAAQLDTDASVQNAVAASGADLIAGGAAGAHTVAGMPANAVLSQVWEITTSTAAHVDLTSEFSVTAANTIDNTGGTATTGDQLAVFWSVPLTLNSGYAAAVALLIGN